VHEGFGNRVNLVTVATRKERLGLKTVDQKFADRSSLEPTTNDQ
jgi:hypothetical protein